MKVLHVGSTLDLSGGIESFIINTYRNLDKTKVQYDFLVTEQQAEGYYKNYILENGGNIYTVKEDKIKISVLIEKYKIYRLYKGDIIQIHTNCGSRIFDGLIARLAGVKHIIFHCHTCKGKATLKFRILQPIFRVLGSDYWACSEAAAYFFFGEKIKSRYRLVHNAIDVERYKFNVDNRIYIRDQNEWNDNMILGFVGRLSPEKNIPFIIEIINILKEEQVACKLVILGEGEERANICKIIREKALDKDVVLLGEKSNVEEYLSAFDALILPSLYEGLGIVLIEAQASGLMCYASNAVPKEANITSKIRYLPLDVKEEKWAKYIISDFNSDNKEREAFNSQVSNSRYNIKIEALVITEMYYKIIGEK